MFERYTDRARRSVVLARTEAEIMHHPEVGTGHLLLGLMAEGGGVAWQALSALGLDLDDARTRVARMPAAAGLLPPNPPFTSRCGKVLELALREALGLGCNYIGTEHLLLGLVREGQGTGASVLVALGVNPEDARSKVLELLHGYANAAVPVRPGSREQAGQTAQALRELIYEQGKVIIDGAIAEALTADRDRLRSCQRVALARMRLAEAEGHPDPDGVISSLRAVLEVIDGE